MHFPVIGAGPVLLSFLLLAFRRLCSHHLVPITGRAVMRLIFAWVCVFP